MRNIAFLLLAATTLIACNDKTETKENGLSKGNLYLATEKPQPGKEFELRYTPRDTAASENTPHGIYYTIVDDNTYASDLGLSMKDSVYTGTVKVPDSATAIAFSFKNGDKMDDNEKQGYVFELYTNDGKELDGSMLSALNFESGIGSYQAGIKFRKDSAAAKLKRYFDKDQKNMEQLKPEYLNLLSRADQDLLKEYKKNYLKKYNGKSKHNEEDYSTLARLYGMTGDQEAYDSISKIAVSDYPKGEVALRTQYMAVYNAKDMQEKERLFNALVDTSEVSPNFKNNINQQIALYYLNEGDTTKFDDYVSKMTDKNSLAYSLNNIAWEDAQKDKNLAQAESLSKKSIDMVREERKSTSGKPGFMTKNQYAEQKAGEQFMYLDTYAYILFKEGKVKEALAAQKEAVDEGQTAQINERYVQYLVADGQYEKAVQKAEEFIKSGQGSFEVMEDDLKTAYTKTQNQELNFEGYKADLEKIEKEKAIAAIRSKMIDEKAPTFTLKNLKGEEIALADLKGKTVVVDFWATWCGPCKASFPGMQKAVEKYQDDPKVAFVFVDTWENNAGDERMKSVQDFITKNKYTFNVLMDNPKEEGSREYVTVSDYEVDGIPTKFVIGPDGHIKFKEVGYDGNNEALVQKLGMMIDLASS